MTPQFRFTFFHSVVSPSGTIVKEPVGWKESALSLERDAVWHSLVEYFKGTFVWIGNARTFLNNIKETYGPDELVRVQIEINYGDAWETLFDGLVDISQSVDISKNGKFYKLQAPIIRDDFWTKFMSRKSIPVDLTASVDLDGNARTAINPITLDLPNQFIRSVFRARMYDWNDNDRVPIVYNFDTSGSNIIEWGILELPVVETNNIQNKFDYTAQAIDRITTFPAKNSGVLFNNFIIKYKGTYTFNFEIYLSTSPYTTPYAPGDKFAFGTFRFVKNGNIVGSFTRTDLGTDGVDGRSKYEYSVTIDLEADDSIFYFYDFTSGTRSAYIVFSEWFAGETSFIEVIADTEFKPTTTDAYKIKDAAESVLSKIIGQDNVLISNKLDTCSGYNAVAKGIHIRGNSMTTKKPFMSLDEWWAGVNPLYCLGIGYDGTNIEIEAREDFYDKVPVLYFSAAANIEKKVHLDKYYKSVEIGFEKWSAESESGVDDPQTKKTYATPFKTIGKDEKVLSKFIGASLAIEQTRRNRVEGGKDWRLDEDWLLIALKSDDSVETGADFDSITGLLNSDSRYNVRHGVARIFTRWQKWFQGCLQNKVGQDFKFTKGEGNYEMVSTNPSGDCEPILTLAEDQDIEITDDFIHLGDEFKVTLPMRYASYKIVNSNRKKAVAIPIDGQWFACHILNLDFKIMGGICEANVLLADETPLESINIIQESGEAIITEDGNYIISE